MVETVTRKRIEILTDAALARRITDAIDASGITGWTITPVQSGKGREGRWREERVMGTDKVLVLSENQSTYIPLGQVHRLANPGKVPLEIIEVQSGSYLGEDDIVRFEDTYGRQ